MLDIQVDPGSAAEVADHFAAVRDRILVAVREGMQEGMQGLAETVAGKFDGSPLQNRTGRLLGAVLSSPRVYETSDVIGGSVGADDPSGLPIDLFLEYGHEYPGNRKREFEESNLRKHPGLRPLALARRLATDRVPAHPFLYPSRDEYGPTILDIIQQKVTDALVD